MSLAQIKLRYRRPPARSNSRGCYSTLKNRYQVGAVQYPGRTMPVNSFSANPWGLYQVHGNVWEWVEDCWKHTYQGAPTDGSAWTIGDCSMHVVRGGAWNAYTPRLRVSRKRSRPLLFDRFSSRQDTGLSTWHRRDPTLIHSLGAFHLDHASSSPCLVLAHPRRSLRHPPMAAIGS
jgi:hypothetical protein